MPSPSPRLKPGYVTPGPQLVAYSGIHCILVQAETGEARREIATDRRTNGRVDAALPCATLDCNFASVRKTRISSIISDGPGRTHKRSRMAGAGAEASIHRHRAEGNARRLRGVLCRCGADPQGQNRRRRSIDFLSNRRRTGPDNYLFPGVRWRSRA